MVLSARPQMSPPLPSPWYLIKYHPRHHLCQRQTPPPPPENTNNSTNAGLVLAQCSRRWANISPAFRSTCLVCHPVVWGCRHCMQQKLSLFNSTLSALKYLCINYGDQRVFQFEIIINVLVISSVSFEYCPMVLIYVHCFNAYLHCGTDFRR